MKHDCIIILLHKFKRELEQRERLSLSNEISVNGDETDGQLNNESSFLSPKFIKSNFIKYMSGKLLLNFPI